MRYSIIVAALVGLSSAWTQPKGAEPIGNPFKTPELATQVPKGKPYEVTWEPTIDKAGTVTILLLRGPGSNAIPQYAIAEKIPNSGSFTWTPAADLEVDVTRYGLQLIVDATGQYQYTPQFGISGKKASGSTSSKSAVGYPTSRPAEPSKATSVPSYSADEPSATNVPPQPSATKSGPVYVTSTYDVTSCAYPTASSGVVPKPSGTGAPVPPGNPGLPPAAPPAGTAPAGSGGFPAPPAQTSEIAAGAAGKTMVASGAAIMAALIAFAL